MDTQYVAEQFEISRRRVQQLAEQDRETDEIPKLDTPGGKTLLGLFNGSGGESSHRLPFSRGRWVGQWTRAPSER